MNLVSELDLPVFDYTAPGFIADTYHRQLEALRQEGWLARSPLAYIVLDRESGEFFLRSRATAFPGRQLAEFFGITDGPLAAHIDANMLNLSGERHRRLRALTSHAFSARAADTWRPAMRGFLRQLWARIGAYGECDFVPAIARPYPALTMAAVIGAPIQDAGRLHEWSSWVQRQFDIRALETCLPEIERAVNEVEDYVTDLLRRRHSALGSGRPGEDLISELLAASPPPATPALPGQTGQTEQTGQPEQDRLSGAECVSLVVNLLAGGIDTTASQLAHAIRLFALHPDQWEVLAERPVLAAAAAEEVLRFEPVTPFTARICTADIEHRGVRFPAGTIVAVCAERVNREEGERFSITALRNGGQLTFGAGAHQCLGASLARAELEEALAFLAPRMPFLALGAPPQLGGVEGIYGIDKLLVTWN
jgi:cytochrome P450